MDIIIDIDTVIPQTRKAPSSIKWAHGYALYLASQLSRSSNEVVSVKLGDKNDYPSGWRDTINRIYNDWCGLEYSEQDTWIP